MVESGVSVMGWIKGIFVHFLVCSAFLGAAGLCFGIEFTLPQLFGAWLVLLALRISLYNNK